MSPEQSKPRIDDALVLAKEFGGIALIPEDMLAEIGYRRMEEGRIVPLEYVPAVEGTLDAKNEAAPFDKLKIDFPRSEIRLTSVQYDYEAMLRRCRIADGSLDDWPSKIPHMEQFVQDFSAWANKGIKSQPPIERFKRTTATNRAEAHATYDMFTPSYFILGENYTDLVEEALHASTLDSGDQDARLNADEIYTLWTELDKLRASAADTDQNRDVFNWLYDPHDLNIHNVIDYDEFESQFPNTYDALFETIPSDEERQAIAKEIATNFNTPFAFFMDTIANYCTQKGLPVIAEIVRTAPNSATAAAGIKPEIARSQDMRTLHEELKGLKNQVRNAPEEKRQELNSQLAAKKKEIKDTKQLLIGMANFFETSLQARQIIAREVKALQKDLITIREDTDERVTLFFDGKLDSAKDKDPGKLTGDCTEGKPLPFDRPEIPVYNVKAYDEETGAHIGNTYLLVTENARGEPTWHLEAIQIPTNKVAWKQFPEHFIKSLSEAAKQQGIKTITMNATSKTISNFDYIGNAFLDYVNADRDDSESYTDTQIRYPKNPRPDTYTDFQGTTDAYTLWTDKES